MNPNYLDFEQPIAELESKIEELQNLGSDSNINILEEVTKLREKCAQMSKDIYADLTPWQITQISRHPKRPYMLDYVKRIFSDFDELHGDRLYADDPAIVSGLARLEGKPVAIIGQQKGRTIEEKLKRNFGMPQPEGYRKALRIMQMAERYELPVLTFIDTPGAYPGIEAEERGQSEAIAKNIATLSHLKTPIIATVIGEGGSGGALAIGVADHVQMLQYSIYSVISPEGCASILWKSADHAKDAAEAMGLTAQKLLELKLIDQIIEEPLGSAYRDVDFQAQQIKASLVSKLEQLEQKTADQLVEQRYQKIMAYSMLRQES